MFIAHVQSEPIVFQSGTTSNYVSSYPNYNRSLSVSVALKAIAQVNQEIKVLGKHRWTNQTVAQGWEWKQSPLRTTPPHRNKELRLQPLSVDHSRCSLSFSCTASATRRFQIHRVWKIKLWKFLKPRFGPVSQKFVPVKITNHMVFCHVLRVVSFVYLYPHSTHHGPLCLCNGSWGNTGSGRLARRRGNVLPSIVHTHYR